MPMEHGAVKGCEAEGDLFVYAMVAPFRASNLNSLPPPRFAKWCKILEDQFRFFQGRAAVSCSLFPLDNARETA